MSTVVKRSSVQSPLMARLTKHSVANDYKPYGLFDWEESPGDDTWWMTPSLLSIHGTEYEDRLDEGTKKRLSKFELVNFFSLNIDGIRGLFVTASKLMYTPGYFEISDFLQRFLKEENDHMWFFYKFCDTYLGKLYSNKTGLLVATHKNQDVESFLTFARVLIFEEFGDYFNITMANDKNLPEIVRKINHVHHTDESLHIAGGRQICSHLFERIKNVLSEEELDRLSIELLNHGNLLIQQLYNPAVYRDAGLELPYEVRRNVMANSARAKQHEAYLKRPLGFFKKLGLLKNYQVPEVQKLPENHHN
jgi:hypothetical protein